MTFLALRIGRWQSRSWARHDAQKHFLSSRATPARLGYGGRSRVIGLRPPDAMGLPTLYSFRRCPYAMRARRRCCQWGCERNVFNCSSEARPNRLILAAAPRARVPVRSPAGTVIDQSRRERGLAQHDPGL